MRVQYHRYVFHHMASYQYKTKFVVARIRIQTIMCPFGLVPQHEGT